MFEEQKAELIRMGATKDQLEISEVQFFLAIIKKMERAIPVIDKAYDSFLQSVELYSKKFGEDSEEVSEGRKLAEEMPVTIEALKENVEDIKTRIVNGFFTSNAPIPENYMKHLQDADRE